jgi:hypothetical protein
MNGEISRYKDLGPLHDLLLQSCPPDKNGRRSIPRLAGLLKVSHQYLYRCIAEEKIPPRLVPKIITLSGGAVSVELFHPFVFC